MTDKVEESFIEVSWLIRKSEMINISSCFEFHSLSRKDLPFYLAEFAYKYNLRNKQYEAFEETIENAVTGDSCFINYKPVNQNEPAEDCMAEG